MMYELLKDLRQSLGLVQKNDNVKYPSQTLNESYVHERR